MGMSDYLFDALESMDPCKAKYYSQHPAAEPTEFHRRYDELYRLVTNGMRMLMLHGDQIQEVNHIAFIDRAMQMLRENDQRPWDVLREELKVELQRPILIPPDDGMRRIDLDSSTGPIAGSVSTFPDEELRQIHIPPDTPTAGEPPTQ